MLTYEVVCIDVCTYVHLPTIIQIVNLHDLHFQGQIFELSILGNSYVIISQTVKDRANMTIAIKQEVTYLNLTGPC